VLRTELGGGRRRFAERPGVALLRTALAFVHERMAEQERAGRLAPWARGVYDDAADALGHPALASFVRVADAAARDPEVRAELEPMLAYVADPARSGRAYDALVVGAVDLLQALAGEGDLYPILAALAPAFSLEVGGVAQGVAFFDQAMALDEDDVLTALLSRLVAERPGRETALEALVDIACKVNRAPPGATHRTMSPTGVPCSTRWSRR